jgi:HEAT repeat protein
LLVDDDVNYKAAWALGQIGDTRAVQPLIGALDNPDALMRVSAIHALVALRAREALPRLRQMLGDNALPKAGDRVPVGETAREAITVLERQR